MPLRAPELCRLLLRKIDAFVFPRLCIVCDHPRPEDDRWLCSRCRNELDALITGRNACPRCGQNRTFRTCTCDVCWDYPFSRIRSFVDYNDTVQSIMHHIKYQGKSALAQYVGRLCSSHIVAADYCDAIVIPIPLHWRRRRKRGFNQAELFARGLFAGTPGSTIATGLLKRVRSTKTQTKLDRSERRRNISGAFRLTTAGIAAVAGKRIVLVDDVITTGATTATAAATLIKGGCCDVEVISFARD